MGKHKQPVSTEFGDLDVAAESAVPPALQQEVSGLYRARVGTPGATLESATLALAELDPPAPAGDTASAPIQQLLAAAEDPALAPAPALRSTELRLDVDGRFPQHVASGTLETASGDSIHWLAQLKPHKTDSWVGKISYTLPASPALPYTAVLIQATRSVYRAQRRATVTFIGRGVTQLTHQFAFQSRYFHRVSLELDFEAGSSPVFEISTGAHPNRPATLPVEPLSLQTVYRRAGFDVTGGVGNEISTDGPDANTTWSDAEMHDAMQVHWSKFADAPQWALWVLFARLHDDGDGLGGVMFDDIGPNHRQGTAVFTDAFIAQPPLGDPDPAAWVARMRFWTAAHEMGHAFNLAHAWQKSLGNAWIPLADEPEARSFMNYPFRVAGDEPAFFADFEFRFTDSELLFLRHAPSQFVQMGNAEWFDNHGLERSLKKASPLQLALKVDRPRAFFAFLEPVVLEIALTNHGAPVEIDRRALSGAAPITVSIARRGGPARRYAPYAHYCLKAQPVKLARGEALKESLFVSAGLNGWDVSEPGDYVIQATLHLPSGAIVSDPLRLRIAIPRSVEEEKLAQDYFTHEVGRVLAFDGSQHLRGANDTLREVVARLGEHPAVVHAQVALAVPQTREFRLLKPDGSGFSVRKPQPEAARKEVADALLTDKPKAVRTLSQVDYKYYATALAHAFRALGDTDTADDLAAAAHAPSTAVATREAAE